VCSLLRVCVWVWKRESDKETKWESDKVRKTDWEKEETRENDPTKRERKPSETQWGKELKKGRERENETESKVCVCVSLCRQRGTRRYCLFVWVSLFREAQGKKALLSVSHSVIWNRMQFCGNIGIESAMHSLSRIRVVNTCLCFFALTSKPIWGGID